jgi:multimeric flavodoxin WrbA
MYMKKVIALNGSPRKQGSTAILVNEILRVAEERGATVKSFFLNGMNIKPCQACYVCKQGGRCSVRDDMQEVLGEIAEADGVVLGTPVVMWQMTAQLKAAIDRLYPFMNPDLTSNLKPGKKVLLAVTQARQDASMFRHYFEYVAKNLTFLGFGSSEILIAGGTRKPLSAAQQKMGAFASHRDVLDQDDVRQQVQSFGRWLAE